MNDLSSVAKVPRNQSAVMMYLSDQVSRGYHYYLSGEVHKNKALEFALKMKSKFDVNLTSEQRAMRHKKGLPNFILIMFPIDEECFLWFVLAAGVPSKIDKIAAQQNEKFESSLDKKTRIALKDYELKRVTKSRSAGGGTRWTWFIKSKAKRMLQEELIRAARCNSTQKLENAVERLRNRPMFSGVRAQASTLLINTGNELCRRKGTIDRPSFLTSQLRFFGKKIRIFD